MAIQRLSGPQFATRFCLRPNQLAWLLGSGASAAAGIPTGYAMIADFKKRLFCQLSGTPLREVDANDSIWIERIDHYLSRRSILPTPGDPTEYAEAFHAVYPTADERRAYIEDAIKKGTPSFAHRAFASLLTMRRVPCVFTTNFDPLVEQSATITDQLVPASDRAYLTVSAIDNADRAELCMRESRWPLLAKLHGDFQSVKLKNISVELQTQDAKLRWVLAEACTRFGLIIVGYSGRDQSIMQALVDACAQQNAFPGGIYWVTSSPSAVLPQVSSLLEAANAAGIAAAFVESQTFDELAADIIDGVDLPAVLEHHVYEARPAPVLQRVPIPTHERRAFPILQCSAIPILSLPKAARRITVSSPISTVRVRELLREAKVKAIAASTGHEIAAFGFDNELARAFEPIGGKLEGTIDLHPEKDSWALGLLYDALTRAVCRNKPLFARMRRSGHLVLAARGSPKDDDETKGMRSSKQSSLQVAYSAPLFGNVPKHGFPFNEGVQLRLENTDDRWWCAFEPVTFVELPRTEGNDAKSNEPDSAADVEVRYRGDPVIDWRRELWASRYNKTWAQIISAWAAMLAGEDGEIAYAVGADPKDGQDALFQLSRITAWSRPGNENPYFQR